ncbi:Crp/Fnr family transcriptional regulator [Amycolatopsis alba]|uniref:Crp/Fnr family transcriptional regulator n=1 Tax=Amycolatopsis alba DSM 44262 TaxID=1125972 RepID=A0A229S0I0_AMYAL|nr:Crp/Fnr family transcriptional regulator [Amycolatopsis alba]OXM52437.1 Crp/Fnr family transcriptional regulator [Amycolatopsis alba DSM 44262]
MNDGLTWRDPVPESEPGAFWETLSLDDRRAMSDAGTRRSVSRGVEICRQGRHSSTVHLLCTGLAEVFRQDEGGIRTILARRRPGQLIGEMSAVDGSPASATVRTLSASVFLVLPAARFVELCHARPGITWTVLRTAVARLRDSDDQRQQYRLDVRKRTILCLLSIAEDARSEVTRSCVPIALTQQELADMVPASLPSVTRILEDLRDAGALRTGRGRMAIETDRLRSLIQSGS